MPRRKRKEIVQVKVRLHSSAVAQLEAAAQSRSPKVSLNAEAAGRLARSFKEEELFDGEAGRQLLYFITTAFVLAGNRAAPGRKLSSWIKDPDAYTAAMFAVIHAMMISQPGATLEKCMLQIASLEGRVATHFVNKEQTP